MKRSYVLHISQIRGYYDEICKVLDRNSDFFRGVIYYRVHRTVTMVKVPDGSSSPVQFRARAIPNSRGNKKYFKMEVEDETVDK